MRRFFQPVSAAPGGDILLAGSEAHHAAHVLRLQKSDDATVLDGAGGEYRCEVLAIGRDEVSLRVRQVIQHPAPRCRVRLVQAITKGKSFELILQKAVELGAQDIQPLLTERVIARPQPAEFASKREKWRQIAIESSKQCGAFWLPGIGNPLALVQALADDSDTDLRLVAMLGPDVPHLRTVFDDFNRNRRHPPRSASIWIGPEGDFTPSELDQMTEAGLRPVSLGSRVLRSETAAISALAVLQYELTAPRQDPGAA